MLKDPGFAIVNTEKEQIWEKQIRMKAWRWPEMLSEGGANFAVLNLTFVSYSELLQKFRSSHRELESAFGRLQ